MFFYEGRNEEGSGIVLGSSVDEVCARNIAASSRSVSKVILMSLFLTIAVFAFIDPALTLFFLYL